MPTTPKKTTRGVRDLKPKRYVRKARTPVNSALDTRSRLVRAARAILLNEGATAASIKRIAAEAGVNHGLVHHYFGSKEALMIAVHELLPFELPTLRGVDVEEDARILSHSMFRDQRVALELLTLSYQMPELNARMRARAEDVFNSYRAVLGRRSDSELTFFGATIMGLAVYSDVHAEFPVSEALKTLLRRFINYPTA